MNIFNLGNQFMHETLIEDFAKLNNISLEESKNRISKLSFLEYHQLCEVGTMITPPSGQTISPTSNSSQQKPTTSATAPQNMKAIWPGKGAPVEVGMTVGLKGPNGMPVPGEISQVDMSAKGVKVKNPTTGQEEWANMDSLEPFMAQGQSGSTTQNITPGSQPTNEDDAALTRMRKLAGINEECSGGATGAGAIASSPAAMGKVKRRTDPVEESPSLEHPVAGRKTIVGATGPQASAIGKLSANNAARGKKSASRKNNGIKKT